MENEWVWRDKGWRQGLLLGDFQWSTSEKERETKTERPELRADVMRIGKGER